MDNIVERSFGINIGVLSFFGLYVSESPSMLLKVRSYVFYLVLLVLVTTLTIINLFLTENLNISEMQDVVIFLVETVSFYFKLLPFLTNGQRIKKCVEYFGDVRFAPRDEKEKEIIEECVQICRRNSMTYFVVLICGVSAWTLPMLFAKGYVLPLYPWLPYNPTSTPLVFYVTYAVLTAGFAYDGFVGGMVDPLIGGLAYHATGQLKVLKYNLQQLDKHVNDTKTKHSENAPGITFSSAFEHLKRCVDHHNDILNFIHEYETCFSLTTFSQFAGSMFGMCFSCIGLLLFPVASVNGVKFVLCFLIIIFQIFFYCHYGTLLFEENNGLINAIYEGPWYRYDVKIRKVLIVLMERSKRPLVLTAGKVVNLTLATFASVLKTSYSLIAVFKNYG